MSALALADLIAPLEIETFLRQHWGQKPLILQRGAASLYRELPDSKEFEFLAHALTNPRDGWFSVVKVMARPASADMLTTEGLLNLSEVYATYVEGNSLLLNQVQRRHRPTGMMCRSLEQAFTKSGVGLSRHIGANAYLSPPNSQGFNIHYDPHDVLILQLEGRKHWRLYGWGQDHWPRKPPTSPVDPLAAGSPQHEFSLSAGDFLYIPRGMLHDAFTDESHSLHLTLSVETLTWGHLFEELMASCADLGQDLPRGYLDATAADKNGATHLRRMLRLLAEPNAVARAREVLAGKLLANLDPLSNGGFSQVASTHAIRATTWLTQCSGNFGHVHVNGTEAILHLPGTTMRAGRSMADAFRYVLAHEQVRAKDLPVDASARVKVAFMRELVKRGFLAPIPKTAIRVAKGITENPSRHPRARRAGESAGS